LVGEDLSHAWKLNCRLSEGLPKSLEPLPKELLPTDYIAEPGQEHPMWRTHAKS
jgi:hypothetical protein